MRCCIGILLFIFLFPGFVPAQKKFTLKIIETGNEGVISKVKYKTLFSTTTEREKELHNVLFLLWNESYLAARYDSLRQDSLSLTAYLTPGEKHKWVKVGKGNVDEDILAYAGFREKYWRNRALKAKDVAKLQENILVYCENHGYPFASIRFDSVVFENDHALSAQLHLDKNRFTKIDSIVVKGNLKLSNQFLYNYIGISPGDPYNESQLAAMDKRLRELLFAAVMKSPDILFTEKYTRLTLYLDNRKCSQFDGIIGFLPNSKTGKLLFTGDASIRFLNKFGHGESVDFSWQRLQEQTQNLKLHFAYPYLFHTPFGVDYSIKLYRLDTTYIDINQSFGVTYMFTGTTSIKAFVNEHTSSLLSTSQFENYTTLPQYADVNTTSYGLAFTHQHLDYRFNPRRGYDFTLSGDAGNRNIRKNAKLNPVIYENIKLKSAQYGGQLAAEKFWPVGKRSTIKTGLQAATIFNTSQVFRNELYRIGGLKTLRGFDEESIYASSYAIGTIEYRFLLEQNSWFFLFADGCWYENNSKDAFSTDTPYGFGTGITFETRAGIFALTYALGSQYGQAIQFKDGKIHVGFVGLF